MDHFEPRAAAGGRAPNEGHHNAAFHVNAVFETHPLTKSNPLYADTNPFWADMSSEDEDVGFSAADWLEL